MREKQDVAKLVNSAGLAIQTLTNAKSDTSASEDSVEARKTSFKAATSQYFALLSSIDVRLRRQVYALEEAGILASSETTTSSSFRGGDAAAWAGGGTTSGTAAGSGGTGAGTGSGSFNPLEISWLNSRKDTVGKDKEAALWAATKEFVTRLQADDSQGYHAKDEKMEED